VHHAEGDALMAIFRGALPADDFAIVANHWFRDPRLSGKAKGYMGYIATHSPKYRLTVEQLIAEMKESKDAVYAGLTELVNLQYLVRTQGNEAGSFAEVDYRFGPAAFEQQYVRAWKGSPKKKPTTGEAQDNETAGQTGSGKPGSGHDQGEQGVSAGGTASGFSGSGKPASGKPDTKKYQGKEDQGLEDQEEDNPPTPPVAGAAAGPGREGDSSDDNTENRDVLNTAVEAAATARSDQTGWSVGAIRRAVRDALGAGHPASVVAAVLPTLAGDRAGTSSPGRLRPYLDAEARKADESKTAPAWASPGPVNYLDPKRPRCPDHRDYPADNCAQHRIDAKVARAEAGATPETGEAPNPGRDRASAARRAIAEGIAAGRAKFGNPDAPPAPLRRHETRPPAAGADLASLVGAFGIPQDIAADQGDADPYGEHAAA
jgi:hypothetical protein